MASYPDLANSTLHPLLDRIGLVAVDIGARGGLEPDLLPIAFATDVIAFEPETDAHSTLTIQMTQPWKSCRILPVALGARRERRNLHVTADRQSSSILMPDPTIGKLFEKPQFFEVQENRPIDVVPLDEVLTGAALGHVGFIKLDVEGAEIEVLTGAARAMATAAAIKIEFSLYPFRHGQPLLDDLIQYLGARGFRLFDLLGLARWRRHGYAIHPFLGGEPVPYSRGSLMHGDALFLRDVLPAGKESDDLALCLRAVAVLASFGYFDHVLMILEMPAIRAHATDILGRAPVQAVANASRQYGRKACRRALMAEARQLASQFLSFVR